jgi:hypothetical protein
MSPFFTNDLTVKRGPDLPLKALRSLDGDSCSSFGRAKALRALGSWFDPSHGPARGLRRRLTGTSKRALVTTTYLSLHESDLGSSPSFPTIFKLRQLEGK